MRINRVRHGDIQELFISHDRKRKENCSSIQLSKSPHVQAHSNRF